MTAASLAELGATAPVVPGERIHCPTKKAVSPLMHPHRLVKSYQGAEFAGSARAHETKESDERW
ncbi:hypothetical protein ACWCXB_31585 [Streptomyces sp. NPDC001514]